ncbi:MAG: hypothetical protein R3F51_26920 [Cyanobacteriota/Melainabacteria group bacterium]
MGKDVCDEQKEVCLRFGAEYLESPSNLKVGISENVKTGLQPIKGLRQEPVGDTTGWYIFAGEEESEDDDFYVPLHVHHLSEWCPAVLKYLGLPPGWGFVIADGYEDVFRI